MKTFIIIYSYYVISFTGVNARMLLLLAFQYQRSNVVTGDLIVFVVCAVTVWELAGSPASAIGNKSFSFARSSISTRSTTIGLSLFLGCRQGVLDVSPLEE
jgi:hypothetical protein